MRIFGLPLYIKVYIKGIGQGLFSRMVLMIEKKMEMQESILYGRAKQWWDS